MIFSTNYNIDFLFDFELGSLGRKCNFMLIRHTHVLIEALEVRTGCDDYVLPGREPFTKFSYAIIFYFDYGMRIT